ncbi:MAG: MmgE/PrpD family protein [Deltaproteobacteria bacterium]|nr:MmgE/PrpD family protein [Deltaproteobacteria bacterium]
MTQQVAQVPQITKALCQAVVQLSFNALPAQVIAIAKRIILDGVAVAVAGAHEDGPRITAAHVHDLGGTPMSTVIGHGFKTSPVSAAYVNGVSMHVLDYEPMWSPPTHAASPTLPTVLALAEMVNAPGREVITAFVKACEIQGRLRLASRQYEPGKLKYHPPGVVGVMGSAVAASHLLQFTPEQLQHALGIAASRAGGVMANVGTMTKATHCGWAAAAGLDAALLARRGFTGNTEIVEAPNGYADVFFGESCDFSALGAFGQSYRMVEPGFAVKMFPSQYATHFGITAGLELHSRIPDPATITSVRITTPVMPYVDRPHPRTGLDGKFSFQYTVAAALLDGAVTVRTFTDERRFRSDMEKLLEVITIVQTDAIPGEMEKMWVDVEVELANGGRVASRCHGPRGFWGLPPLSRDEHLTKVCDCLEMRLTRDQTERCIQLAEKLDELEADGVQELVTLAGC